MNSTVGISEILSQGIGQNIIVILETYPFFVVGTFEYENNDQIGVMVQFGVPVPLNGNLFHIRKDSIAAFYADSNLGNVPTVW